MKAHRTGQRDSRVSRQNINMPPAETSREVADLDVLLLGKVGFLMFSPISFLSNCKLCIWPQQVSV